MKAAIELSVIIPVGTRHDDVEQLLRDYCSGLDALGLAYELIYVLDGPHSTALEVLSEIQAQRNDLEILQLARPFGEATAIAVGFGRSRGRLILTLPAYYQIESGELSKLLVAKDTHHMVVARRWPRRGSRLEQFRRAGFHTMLRWVTGQSFQDLGCGVRLMDRNILDEIALYGDQHRFLPVIVERNGFRVREVDVKQSSRDEFRGRYTLQDYLRRVLDMFTVFFLVRFTKRPLRFFGTIGTLIFLAGGVCLTYVVVQRLFFGMPLADRPALLLSSLLVVLGSQVFGLGLLGELIIFTHARDIKEYHIERIVDGDSSEAAE